MAHCMVVAFGLAIAAFSTGLHYAGYCLIMFISVASANQRDRISMGFLYLFMGVLVSSAVLPACLTLLWNGQNKQSAMLSPPIGLVLSLIAWFVTAQQLSGELTVETLGANYPMLAGNVVALVSPCVIIPLLTLIYGVGEYYLLRRTVIELLQN
jgi:Na+/proline symporter